MSRKFGMRPWRRRTVYLAVAIGVGVGGFLIVRKVWRKRAAAATETGDAVVTLEGGEVLQVVDGEGGGAVPAIVNEEEVHGINAEDAAVAILTGGVDEAVLGREGIGAVPAIVKVEEEDLAILHVIKAPLLSRSGRTAAFSRLISANTALHISMIEGVCFDTLSDTRGAAVMSHSEDAAMLATFLTKEREALVADAISIPEVATGTEAADVNDGEGSIMEEGTADIEGVLIKEEGTAADSTDASITPAGTEALTTVGTGVESSLSESVAGYKNEDDDTDAAVGKSSECDFLIDATIDDVCLIDEEILLVVGKTSGEEPPAAVHVAIDDDDFPAIWRTGPMMLKQRTVTLLREANMLTTEHEKLLAAQKEPKKIKLNVDVNVVRYLAVQGEYLQPPMFTEWYGTQDPRMQTLDPNETLNPKVILKAFKKEAKERERLGLPPFTPKATSAAAAPANPEPDETVENDEQDG